MRKYLAELLALSALLLFSCARQNTSTGPHATVFLRDGSQLAGTITSSSPTEVTVRGDDNTTRTIAMKDLRSIEYDEVSTPPPAGQAKEALKRPKQALIRQHPEESAITTKTYELPVGTELHVRTDETIDSARAVKGQTYAAEVTEDVRDSNGDVVIPSGANAQIVIRAASGGGRVSGTSELVLDLATVSVGGRQYQLSTVDLRQAGKPGFGANKRTAEYTGGGAAIGAIIGAIAGSGKGAAIGGGSGAAAGAITQVVTKGSSIKVPAETVLTFKLDRTLRVVAAN